jgi:Transposase, Mutator family
MHTMPRGKLRPTLEEVKALLAADQDFLRPLVQAVLQELLEAEMTEALGAEKGERTPARLGYRAGYYPRTLITRVGKLELRVPQDRHGHFSTELFERYQRSERALVAALAEMYVQGVSTRKVKAVTEELCGHSFSAAAISAINTRLDQELAQFAGRRLDEACPYLILDARYERVREAGVIRSQAVLLAIGIGWDGRRSILAVELANRESRSSWREFLLQLPSAASQASSSWSRTTMPGSGRRSSRCCRKPPGNAATCTSCAMRSITCPARSTTTACGSCAGSTTGAISPRRGGTWQPGSPSGRRPTPSSVPESRSTSRRP